MIIVNIHYGDISNDGHNQTGSFLVEVEGTKQELLAAINEGASQVGFDFDNMLDDYEDDMLKLDMITKLEDLGFDSDGYEIDEEEEVARFWESGFEDLLIFFANLANPKLDVKLAEDIEHLELYAGYGLFSC